MAAGTKQPGTDEDELVVTKQIDCLFITASFCTIDEATDPCRSSSSVEIRECSRICLTVFVKLYSYNSDPASLLTSGARQGKHYRMTTLGVATEPSSRGDSCRHWPGPSSLHFMLSARSLQHLGGPAYLWPFILTLQLAPQQEARIMPTYNARSSSDLLLSVHDLRVTPTTPILQKAPLRASLLRALGSFSMVQICAVGAATIHTPRSGEGVA